MESYVTQETHLFHDSIARTISRSAKPGASREEIIEAAKKASIHDFIHEPCRMVMIQRSANWEIPCQAEKSRGSALPGLFSMMRPSCSSMSQPSNLDSLNEGIILKSLRESCDKKTVVLVSHRQSTMQVADEVYEMENGRILYKTEWKRHQLNEKGLSGAVF